MTLARRSAMKRRPPKPKTCVICGDEFVPDRVGQKVCCPVPCGVEHGKQLAAKKKAKEERDRKAHTRAQLEALKPPGQRLREATKRCQIAFNAWVRERDRDQPCISCGTHTPGGGGSHRGHSWDCGHYRTTGAAPELRFEPLNAHKQCVSCNRDRSGHVVKYRVALMDRIGAHNLAWLEGPHPPKRWTVEDLDAMAAEYRRKTRELQSGRA